MASLTPILTSTPNNPTTYNVGMAETFSWVPIEGANRPLFARAGYITNLSDLTVNLTAVGLNMDDLEDLTIDSNTLLSKLTAQQTIQTDKQDEIITLLNAITATAIEVDLNTDQLELHVDGVEGKQDLTNTMLAAMTANIGTVPGFNIPPYTEIQFQYVGSTDIFRQVIYLNNSTQVLSLSFTYVTEPPTTGNAVIQSVKKI